MLLGLLLNNVSGKILILLIILSVIKNVVVDLIDGRVIVKNCLILLILLIEVDL